MAYLYNFIGKPYKTQKLTRQVMKDLYGADPAGLCGNEDCGQMSAWFVFSAMGFYPVTPGIGYYAIGSPLFEEVRVNLEDGKVFIIRAENNNTSNIYIQSAKLYGESYGHSFINHNDVVRGGELVFEMGSLPNSGWATKNENRPVSAVSEHLISPVPYFEAVSSTFQENILVGLRHIDQEAVIFYRQEGYHPGNIYEVYRNPVLTSQSSSFHAYAEVESLMPSKKAKSSFYKIHHDWAVSVKSPYSSQYTGGGDLALIDGQRGGDNFRTGSWQGYYGVDFEATIDMGKITTINKIKASFLQDQRSWIFMPVNVEFSVSRKSFDFRTVAIIENDVPDTFPEAIIKEFVKDGMKESGRYIRIRATNRGVCPEWHVGAGEKAWVFIDEIIVE
jgi:hypothetical protein